MTCEAWSEREHVKALEVKTPVPGTLGALMAAHKESPAFADLAPATKAGHLRYFDVAKALHALPPVEIDPPFLAPMRGKIAMKRGRRTANYVLAVISLLFTDAKEHGYKRPNPVLGVKRDKSRPKANRPGLSPRRQGLRPKPLSLQAMRGMSSSLRPSRCRTFRSPDGKVVVAALDFR